jgi:DNA primase
VFQVRGVEKHTGGVRPVILSHSGRALSAHQEHTAGKYWQYPFHKGWEIYNQDNLLLDPRARRQTSEHGLVLVEGFFDVAAMVEAGCLNVGALMGTAITDAQIQRLKWIRSLLGFPHLTLFLDRDEAGKKGASRIRKRLEREGFTVKSFDWNQRISWNGHLTGPIPDSIVDPGDLSPGQLRRLRDNGTI